MKHIDPREFESPEEAVLRRASARVRAGWVQYRAFAGPFGAPQMVCASEALHRSLAEAERPVRYLAAIALKDAVLNKADAMQPRSPAHTLWGKLLRRIAGSHWESIPDWNDAKGRTADQVIAVFDAVRRDIAIANALFAGETVRLPALAASPA
jgi:hypothetical protein